MNQIAFVAAAYGVAIAATALLIGWSWVTMRRAEDALERRRNHGD